MDDGGFEGPHNGAITWRHLLQQTSEWEGTLFGKSDIIDRNRNLAVEGKGRKGDARPLQAPGSILGIQRRAGEPAGAGAAAPLPPAAARGVRRTHHAADRRIGRLELARLSHVDGGDRRTDDRVGVGRQPLGRRRRDPRRGPGAHRPADAASWRVGGARLLPESWIDELLTPCALNPNYGLLWWLNTGRTRYPNATETSFFASGAGGNITWVDPENDLVAVMRWMDPASVDGFIRSVMAAIEPR